MKGGKSTMIPCFTASSTDSTRGACIEMIARVIIFFVERWWPLWLFWLFHQWLREQQRMMADDSPRENGEERWSWRPARSFWRARPKRFELLTPRFGTRESQTARHRR